MLGHAEVMHTFSSRISSEQWRRSLSLSRNSALFLGSAAMKRVLLLFSLLAPNLIFSAAAPPLYTDSRWIVDSQGRRTKLACVNWGAHLKPMITEGLSKQPLATISSQIAVMGFNCVRLTWALYMITDVSLSSLTVLDSLRRLGLDEAAEGVERNNPEIAGRTVLQAFQDVVSSLSSKDIMVIVDNRLSKPGWCCSKVDGNGFFGDEFFDPEEWLRGLSLMAAFLNGSTNVIAFSLRNELRGPRQNVDDWYRYMQRGAEAVHSANHHALVILSGLDFDKDLYFLHEKLPHLSFSTKHLFELHWYGFSDGGDWQDGNPNEVCGSVTEKMKRKALFLLELGIPLFLGEFGLDQTRISLSEGRFLSCMMAMAAELDMDWALWALQGSYYVREGEVDMDETYGILSYNWDGPRNSYFLPKISTLQLPLQGPGLSENLQFQMIFHPKTGKCLIRNPKTTTLNLGPCDNTEAWSFTNGRLFLQNSNLGILAEAAGKPARVRKFNDGDPPSTWKIISDSRLHISSMVNGARVCMDAADSDGSSPILFTNLCKCLSSEDKDANCDPLSQWFKIVDSTRSLGRKPMIS